MEPVEHLIAIQRNWLLIALLTALGVAAGLIAGFFPAPNYRATASVLLVPGANVERSELGQLTTFMNSQIHSYAELASSPMVLESIAVESSLPLSAKDLTERVSAEVPIDTFVIEIDFVAPDPAQAADLANATARQLGNAVSRAAPRNEADAPVVELQSVGVATPPEHPESPHKRLRLAVGAGAGLFLGIVVAMARHSLSSRHVEDKASAL